MQGVHPDLVLVYFEAIKDSPIDFGVPSDGGVRTAQRQNEMYLDPSIKTNCDGHENKSKHQIKEGKVYGEALDFYAYVNNKASWDEVHLAMVAAVLMATAKRLRREGKIKIEIEWGGTFGSNNFKGWDMPHFNISN